MRLSVAERLELVQEVWVSIALDCEREPYPLSEEQRRDLEKRLAEADAAPTGGASWHDGARAHLVIRRTTQQGD